MWKGNHCPACHRLLYSRSRTRCGWCLAALPQECRMDDEAVEFMKEEIRAIEKRRAATKARENNPFDENYTGG
jgi:hypothetical protein